MKITLTEIHFSPKFIRAVLPMLCLMALFGGIMGNGSVATAQDALSDLTFETPEETITFYMQSLAAGEIPAIMQTLAVDEMSKNFRFDLYVERLRALNFQAPAPSDDAFYTEINRAQFLWQILFQTRNLTYGLLTTDPALLNGQTIIIDAEETTAFATEFISNMDLERLAQLQIVTIAIPSPELVQSERNVENWDRLARIYGADELTERVVLFVFEGDSYLVGFTLLRYEDDWKISSIQSALGNTSSTGGPVQTTEEEFQELVGGS